MKNLYESILSRSSHSSGNAKKDIRKIATYYKPEDI